MTNASDAALARRLMSRDESALRECMTLYGGIVIGMAKRVLRDPSMAEEVGQDVFVALWRRPGAFDPARGTLKAFLCAIARNKAIDLVRKEASAKRAHDALLEEFDDSIGVAFESQLAVKSEVVTALMSLPEAQRHALALAYFGGRTYREVAVELETPEGTVKTRMRDGLLRLRSIMVDPRKEAPDG
jgi:RNA polymerase sigma-70 factor, ECF subfamily